VSLISQALEVLQRLAEVVQDLPVDELHLAGRSKGGDQSRNAVDDQAAPRGRFRATPPRRVSARGYLSAARTTRTIRPALSRSGKPRF
jgi:hypothetical protein